MTTTPPEVSPDSILNMVKKALGLAVDDATYDLDLIMHINAVLAEYNQLGVGPEEGFVITGADETWADFLGGDPRYNLATSLAYMKVKMMFDPPNVGYVLTSWEKIIEEAQWRLHIAREDIVHPTPDPTVEPKYIEVDRFVGGETDQYPI